MINVEVIGKVIKKPKKRISEDGIVQCNIEIATIPNCDENSITNFKATLFGDEAENAIKYLKKGSQVSISGKLNFKAKDNKGIEKIIPNAEIEYLTTNKNKEN